MTQILGGILAEMFGAKWLFGGAIFTSAVLTVLMPLAAKTSFYLLFALRFIEGFVQGVVYPSLMVIISRYEERI